MQEVDGMSHFSEVVYPTSVKRTLLSSTLDALTECLAILGPTEASDSCVPNNQFIASLSDYIFRLSPDGRKLLRERQNRVELPRRKDVLEVWARGLEKPLLMPGVIAGRFPVVC